MNENNKTPNSYKITQSLTDKDINVNTDRQTDKQKDTQKADIRRVSSQGDKKRKKIDIQIKKERQQ